MAAHSQREDVKVVAQPQAIPFLIHWYSSNAADPGRKIAITIAVHHKFPFILYAPISKD